MHGTVRVLQYALPRLPQVLLFQVYLSEPTSPTFASKPPIATEHLIKFSFSDLFTRSLNKLYFMVFKPQRYV
jgi:hypothetical protein